MRARIPPATRDAPPHGDALEGAGSVDFARHAWALSYCPCHETTEHRHACSCRGARADSHGLHRVVATEGAGRDAGNALDGNRDGRPGGDATLRPPGRARVDEHLGDEQHPSGARGVQRVARLVDEPGDAPEMGAVVRGARAGLLYPAGERASALHELLRDVRLPVRVADVEITLTDGTRLAERVTAVRGTPRNPMTRPEVVDKARDLIDPVLGADKSAKLVDVVFNLERLGGIRELRPLLQRP